MVSNKIPKAVKYELGSLYFLDQTKLPLEVVYEEQKSLEQIYISIKTLKVRGAPAIGIAGAFGLIKVLKDFIELNIIDFKEKAYYCGKYLISSRPTAVNLSWSITRLFTIIDKYIGDESKDLWILLESEAIKIYNEDCRICEHIGFYGAKLLKENMGVLTHCNAGALAVSEKGTALSPIYTAIDNGLSLRVFADETRPLLQGARLTSWELMQAGVDVTLICDNMAAYVMSKGLIDIVIVGCDRVAVNGDTANKIGTLSVAVLANHFNIPFYVACPSSTFDADSKTGSDIIIEERDGSEITFFGEKQTGPTGVKTYNPAFDITPNKLITGFITEKGIITKPYDINLINILG